MLQRFDEARARRLADRRIEGVFRRRVEYAQLLQGLQARKFIQRDWAGRIEIGGWFGVLIHVGRFRLVPLRLVSHQGIGAFIVGIAFEALLARRALPAIGRIPMGSLEIPE